MNNENAVEISNKDLLEILQKTIKEEGSKSKEDIKRYIKAENKELLKKIDEQSDKINELEKQCEELRNKLLLHERKSRKNNIIIFGLIVPEGDLLNFVLNKLNALLEINIVQSDINNIYKIKTANATHVKVEFTTYLKKLLTLRNAPKLKGTGVFIAEDLSYEDRENRKILLHHHKLAKSKNFFTKIVGNKLKINNETFSAEQLKAMNYNNKSDEEEFQYFVSRKSNSAPSTPTLEISGNQLQVCESSLGSSSNKNQLTNTDNTAKALESKSSMNNTKQKKTASDIPLTRTSSRTRMKSTK